MTNYNNPNENSPFSSAVSSDSDLFSFLSETDGWKPSDAKMVLQEREKSNTNAQSSRQAYVIDYQEKIVELARALRHDVDLIFFHVYNNIQFTPSFGLEKGGWGCMVDKIGNPFDQCQLMVDLLRASGYSADYLYGTLDLSVNDAAAWLGCDSSNYAYAAYMYRDSGVPVDVIWDEDEWRIKISHIWVKVTIDSIDYVFDPSYKHYGPSKPGIDLASGMQYSSSSLLAAAEAGATKDPNGVWIQNTNYANLCDQLKAFSGNLSQWITTNFPTATTDDIIGGRSINQINTPIRNTSLPYQDNTTEPVTWTTIPNSYRISVQIFSSGMFNFSVFSDQVYGQRVTAFFSPEPETTPTMYRVFLKSGGSEIATSTNTVPANGVVNYTFTFTHPYSPFNNSVSLTTRAPYASGNEERFYNFGFGFGVTTSNLVSLHEDQSEKFSAEGFDELSEEVLGSRLAAIWFSYLSQVNSMAEITCRLTKKLFLTRHWVALCGRDTHLDVGLIDSTAPVASILNLDGTSAPETGTTIGLLSHTLEALSIQQMMGNKNGISSNYYLRSAIASGQKIYKGTAENWDSDVAPNLINHGTLNLNSWVVTYLNQGYATLIPEESGHDIGGFDIDYCFAHTKPSGAALGLIGVLTPLKGGLAKWGKSCNCFCKQCEEKEADPVGLLTGAYSLERHLLTVGDEQWPYSLSFVANYSSENRNNKSSLGFGWSHNWVNEIVEVSEPDRALGGSSPLEAIASLVSVFTCLELLSDTTLPITKLISAWLLGAWWSDELTLNVVSAQLLNSSVEFVKLPDASYSSTGKKSWHLSKVEDSYIITDPQRVQYAYDENNLLASITFPYGIQVSLNYVDKQLMSISNNTGRAIFLSYDETVLSQVTDATGRSIEFIFDTDFQLSSIIDELGESTTFNYSALGLLVSYFQPQFPSTPVVQNTYDTNGRIQSQLDVNGNEQEFYFAGWRTEFVNATDDSIVYIFDTQNNLMEKVDELGHRISFLYDGLSRTTTLTFPEGNRINFEYDENDNLNKIIQEPKPGSSLNDITQSFIWNMEFNKITSSIDAKGNATNYHYDNLTGQLILIELPTNADNLSASVSYRYDEKGKILSIFDEMGMQTQYSYNTVTKALERTVRNSNWKVVFEGEPAESDHIQLIIYDSNLTGGQKSITYSVLGTDTLTSIAANITAIINTEPELVALGIEAKALWTTISLSTSNNDTTSFTSASTGSVIVTLQPGLKLTTTANHNPVGDITSVIDPDGNLTLFNFDSKRRLTQIQNPLNILTKITYDKNDNRLTVERETGEESQPWLIISSSYNPANLLESITDFDGNSTTFNYTPLRQIHRITDAENRTVEYEYTKSGQIGIIQNSATQASQTFSYNDNGTVASSTNARGFTIIFDYDGFDRISRMLFPDGTSDEILQYDANSNALNALTRADKTISFEFDKLNRITKKSPEGMSAVSMDYDLSGRLISVSTDELEGDPASGSYNFQYDSAGRLSSEKYPDGKTVEFELTASGNVSKIVYPDGWFLRRTYDELNRLIAIYLNQDVAPLATFTYDKLSRRTNIDFANNTNTTYRYHSSEHLSHIGISLNNLNIELDYDLNKANDLISQAALPATLLWVPSEDSTTVYANTNSLDQYLEVQNQEYDYNLNGCLTEAGDWHFTYDVENRLVQATDNVNTASYQYDPLNRRILRSHDTDTTRTVYSGWQRIVDYDSMDILLRRYVFGTGIDEPLAEIDSNGDITYLHADRLGSIIALSDAQGIPEELLSYSPFGLRNSSTGYSHFSFTGQVFDEGTGLYYFKNRYYSPSLGRFLQPDPLLSLNLYAYTGNDPLNRLDPLGLQETGMMINHITHFDLPPFRTDTDFGGLLNRGCNGLCCLMQDTGQKNRPEEDPNTVCFKYKFDAQVYARKNCPCNPFIFGIQGKWLNGVEPVEDKNHMVPNNSIDTRPGQIFNYQTPLPSALGYNYYFGIDHCAFENGKYIGQQMWVGHPIPTTEKYPNEIWCVTCRDKKDTKPKCKS